MTGVDIQPDAAYYDVMPCPQCGSQELIQHTSQSETVEVDEHGDPTRIDPRTITVEEVWCPECDEKLWEKG